MNRSFQHEQKCDMESDTTDDQQLGTDAGTVAEILNRDNRGRRG